MKNPWKDIAPYTVEDAANFKGRKEEITKFSKILERGNFAVIYAESGIGKTSFLNAGIRPLLEKQQCHYITVEFPKDVLTSDEIELEEWLCGKIFQQGDIIAEGVGIMEEDTLSIGENSNNSLWWHLRGFRYRKTVNYDQGYVTPVIVFDQFEEVFQKSSPTKLAELFGIIDKISSNIPPVEIREEIERQNEEGKYVELKTTTDFKVIFSLRKEYLAEFDYWTNDATSIPQLLQNRMILLPFTKDQAEEVIMLQTSDGQIVETLHKVKDEILKLFEKKNSPNGLGRKEIGYEAFLLSVICSRLYEISVEKGKTWLSPEDLSALDINTIIYNFYIQGVNGASIPRNHLRIIEDELVDDNGERNRVKSSTKNLDAIGFKHKYLNPLASRHIIKHSDGYIELIHDRVALSISQRRKAINSKKWNRIQRFVILLFIILASFTALRVGWSTKNRTTYDTREITATTFHYPEEGKSIPGYTKKLVVTDLEYNSLSIRTQHELEEVYINHKYSTVFISANVCNNLHTLEISDNIENLYLTIRDCNNLKYIELPDSIKHITYDIVGDICFDVPESASDRFLFEEGILWDLEKHEPIYINEPADSAAVLFPDALKGLASTKYNHRPSGHRFNILNSYGTFPQIKTSNDTIVGAVLYGADTLDLSGPQYSHIRTIDKEIFAYCASLKHVVLPDSLEHIDASCFIGCKNLESVVFPQTVETIADEAFKNCSSLKEINLGHIGNNVSIGRRVFEGCLSLIKTTLPEHINFTRYLFGNSISFDQFMGCRSLQSINIVTAEGERPMEEREGVVFYNDIPLYAKPGFNYNDYRFTTKDSILYCKTYLVKAKYLISVFTHKESIVQNGSSYAFIYNCAKTVYAPPIENLLFFNSDSIEELHLGSIYPESIIGITEKQKGDITLYVPYGSRKHYSCNPDYQGFKAIKEDPWHLRIKNLILEMWDITVLNIKVYPYLKYIIAIIGIILMFVVAIALRKQNPETRNLKGLFNHRNSSMNTIVLFAYTTGVAAIVVFTTTWISVYWMLFFWLEGTISNTIALIISHATSFVAAAFATWSIVYQKDGNIWINLKKKINAWWLVFRNTSIQDIASSIYGNILKLWAFIVKHRKKILICAAILMLCCMGWFFIDQYLNKPEQRNTYVNQFHEEGLLSYIEIRKSTQTYDEYDDKLFDISIWRSYNNDVIFRHTGSIDLGGGSNDLVARTKSSEKNILLVADIWSGEVLKNYEFSKNNRIASILFNTTGTASQLVTATDNEINLIDVTGNSVSLLDNISYKVPAQGPSLALGKEGKHLLCFTKTDTPNSTIKLYDLNDPNNNKEWNVYTGISDAYINYNGSQAVTLNNGERNLIIWDTKNTKAISEINNMGYRFSARYNYDGSYFVTSNGGYGIYILDKNGIKTKSLSTDYKWGEIRNVQFSNDSKEIIAITKDNYLLLMDAKNGFLKMTAKVDFPELYFNNTNYYNGNTMVVVIDGHFVEIAPKSFSHMKKGWKEYLKER